MDIVKRRGTFYAPEGRPGNDGEWTFYGGDAALKWEVRINAVKLRGPN